MSKGTGRERLFLEQLQFWALAIGPMTHDPKPVFQIRLSLLSHGLMRDDRRSWACATIYNVKREVSLRYGVIHLWPVRIISRIDIGNIRFQNTLRRNFPAKSWFSFAALQCGERKKRLMKPGKWAGTKIRNPFTKIERRVRSALSRSSSAKARRRVKTGVENPSIRDEVLFFRVIFFLRFPCTYE